MFKFRVYLADGSELQALRDEDVDLEAGVIHVQRGWDKIVGPIAPKSRAAVRKVPIIAAHRLRRGEQGGLFFGSDVTAFNDDTVRNQAIRA